MKTIQSYKIREVQKADYGQVIEFMMRIRKEVFPMLNEEEIPQDLLDFDHYYTGKEKTNFFAAFSETGKVLGTIGICPYDGRFTQLPAVYDAAETAEIVKCYIDRDCRRCGIGTSLFEQAARFSYEAGYQTLYLHTHPFLPGAIAFWRSQGFVDQLAETDGVWNTLHMNKKLKN